MKSRLLPSQSLSLIGGRLMLECIQLARPACHAPDAFGCHSPTLIDFLVEPRFFDTTRIADSSCKSQFPRRGLFSLRDYHLSIGVRSRSDLSWSSRRCKLCSRCSWRKLMVMSPRVRSLMPRTISVNRRKPPVIASG